jgi:hypothetical protein
VTESRNESDGKPARPRAREVRERREGWESPAPAPNHYAKAARYADEADAALKAGDIARAQTLAAIGQIHATLATASATAHLSTGSVAPRRPSVRIPSGRTMGDAVDD